MLEKQPPNEQGLNRAVTERMRRIVRRNQAIRRSIQEADADRRNVDFETATTIAGKYHRGPDTAMYRFAATGRVRHHVAAEMVQLAL